MVVRPCLTRVNVIIVILKWLTIFKKIMPRKTSYLLTSNCEIVLIIILVYKAIMGII